MIFLELEEVSKKKSGSRIFGAILFALGSNLMQMFGSFEGFPL